MVRSNVRLMGSEVIQMQRERRREVDELAKARTEYDEDHDPMYALIYGCVALVAWTAVVIVWWVL